MPCHPDRVRRHYPKDPVPVVVPPLDRGWWSRPSDVAAEQLQRRSDELTQRRWDARYDDGITANVIEGDHL
jgi:hypothetical protein